LSTSPRSPSIDIHEERPGRLAEALRKLQSRSNQSINHIYRASQPWELGEHGLMIRACGLLHLPTTITLQHQALCQAPIPLFPFVEHVAMIHCEFQVVEIILFSLRVLAQLQLHLLPCLSQDGSLSTGRTCSGIIKHKSIKAPPGTT